MTTRDRYSLVVAVSAVVCLVVSSCSSNAAAPQTSPTSNTSFSTPASSGPASGSRTPSGSSAPGATASITAASNRTAPSSGADSSAATTKPASTVAPGRAAQLGLKPVEVPVVVQRSRSNVVALAELQIHGKPYYFVVDTGASVTVIDSSVAVAAKLTTVSTAGQATTLGCKVPIQTVAISNWAIGGQALPSSIVPSQKIDFAGKKINNIPVAGLLGADLFYLYGTMSLHYTDSKLTLGQPAPSGTKSFPIHSLETKTGVTIQADVTVHHTHALFAVDTGASTTEIDGTVAKAAGLAHVGPAGKIGTVSCTTPTQPVTFDDSSVGSVSLPTVTAVAATAPAPTTSGRQGLLGSDILSTFGTVTFDFVHQKVDLG